MMGRGILGKHNRSNLGKSIVIAPTRRPGAGDIIYQEDFNNILPGINAEQKDGDFDPQNISMAFDVFQTDNVGATEVHQVWLQLLLAWEVASAQFGMAQEGTTAGVAPGVYTTKSQVLVDLQFGTVFTLPAVTGLFQTKIRYKSRRSTGFTGNVVPGPSYRINAGMSYDSITPAVPLTFTDDYINLAKHGDPGDTVAFTKPKFAQNVQFVWNTAAIGPLQVQFASYTGQNVQVVNIPAGLVTFPVMPWPQGAGAAVCVNQDAANPMNNVTAISQLSL